MEQVQSAEHKQSDDSNIDPQNNFQQVNHQKEERYHFSLIKKGILYILFAIFGILLFNLLYAISNYISLGVFQFGPPKAEFAQLGYVYKSLIGIPLYILFGFSIVHAIIHRRLGKFFILMLIIIFIGTAYLLLGSSQTLSSDDKKISNVLAVEEELKNECKNQGFYNLVEHRNIYNPDGRSLAGTAECELTTGLKCYEARILYTLTGERSDAPGSALDEDGPAYGYSHRIDLVCDESNNSINISSIFKYGLHYDYEEYIKGGEGRTYEILEKKKYYINPDGTGLRELTDYDYISDNEGEDYLFRQSFSPDGKTIAQTTDSKILELIDYRNDSLVFSKELDEDEGSIYTGIWNRDSSVFVYTIYEKIPGQSPLGNSKINFYAVNSNGSNNRLIGIHDKAQSIALVDIDLRNNKLYWMETGEGGFRNNFTVYDISNKRIESIRNKVVNDSALIMSNDFNTIYTSGLKKIYEYDLKTDTNKLLYEFIDTDEDQYGNPSYMNSYFSSDALRAYVTERYEPEENVINFILDLKTGKLDKIFEGKDIQAISISPDNRYILYTSMIVNSGKDMGNVYVYDALEKNLNLILSYRKQGVGSKCVRCENIYSFEWVRNED